MLLLVKCNYFIKVIKDDIYRKCRSKLIRVNYGINNYLSLTNCTTAAFSTNLINSTFTRSRLTTALHKA